jgi:hypothetical protein
MRLIIRIIAIYLLVLMATAYVGLGFTWDIMCPVEYDMDTLMYAKYWQMVDGYMGKRMPIFGAIWSFLYLINLVVFFKTRKQAPIFWIILVCFMFHIADIIVANMHQIPINQYFQSLDMNNLTEAQLKTLAELRIKTNQNFSIRGVFGVLSFFLMSITPYLLPKEVSETNKVQS